MKKTVVPKILERTKKRESLGIEISKNKMSVSQQISNADKQNQCHVFNDSSFIEADKNNRFNSRKNQVKQIVHARKNNDWNDLRNISLAYAYAAILTKLSFEISGKKILPFVEKKIAEKWKTTFVKLDAMLSELKIPTILYLRIHLKLARGNIVVPALASHNAINRFVDYLERELSEKYLMPADIENAIVKLSSLDYDDDLRQLLAEYRLGAQYLDDVRRYSAILDDDLLLLLELRNLPGGYLVSLDLTQLRECGAITDEIAEKIDTARARLAKPGIRAAFVRETSL